MKKYKALILDLDGTLLNTIEDLRDAINYAMENHGLPTHDLATIRSFVGNGNRMLLEHALKDGKEHTDFEQLFVEYRDYYLSHATVNTRPYPGVMEVIEYCRDNGIKTAVLTNKIDEAAKRLVAHFFGDLIPVVMGDTQKAPKKPDPDPGYRVCKELGVEVSDCLYVGDSDVDGIFANNVGMDCLIATYGFNDMDKLKDLPCIAFINEAKDILKYI